MFKALTLLIKFLEFRIIGLSEKQPCQLMSSENTISVDKKLFDSGKNFKHFFFVLMQKRK